MKKLVSIVIPCYNSEKYLNKCIESIVNQTYEKIEVILINDGSQDKTLSILKDWEKKDDRIIVIDKKNSGVSDTRNKGIEVSTGEYITFIDSDDYIDVNMVETLVSELDEETDIVLGGFRFSLEDGTIKKEIAPKEKKILTNKEFYEELLKEKEFIASFCGRLFRTELMKKYKIDKTLKISEDLDFLLRISNDIRNVKLVPNTYYYYFMNENSVTHSTKFEKYKDELNVLEKNKNNRILNKKLWECRYLRINLNLYFRYKKTEKENVQYCLEKIKKTAWTIGLSNYFNLKQKIKFIIAKII